MLYNNIDLSWKSFFNDEIQKEYTGFNTSVKLTKRSGPNETSRFYPDLLESNIFKASGNSSNIVTSPSDLSLVLTESEKNKAEEKFRFENPSKNPPTKAPYASPIVPKTTAAKNDRSKLSPIALLNWP